MRAASCELRDALVIFHFAPLSMHPWHDAYPIVATAQIAVVLAVCALALTVCVALISTSELRPRSVALYGIGSGEEDDADQATTVTFEVGSLARA